MFNEYDVSGCDLNPDPAARGVSGLPRESGTVRPTMQNIARTRPSLVRLALAGASLVLASAALADSADAFNISISQSLQHDDNLYRLADGVQPFGTGPRGDTISITSLSATFERRYSLQNLSASVDLARVGFDTWDTLDYSTRGGKIRWDWAIAKRWTGVLSASQDETARDFGDLAARRESSVSRQRTYAAEANYWWHPDWAGGVGFEQFSSAYSDTASQTSDYDAAIGKLKLTYRPRSGNSVALAGRFTDGSFPNRQAGVLSDDGFRQTDWRVEGQWQLTGHSQLSGYLGFTRRRHPNLTYRDYAGLTGRLTHLWLPTGKLSVSTVVRREIGARDDLVDNFVVTRALSLSPTWSVSPRVALQGRVEWRERDFRGDPGIINIALASQNDRTRIFNVGAYYTPIDALRLSLSYSQQVRDSDLASASYTARVASFSAQYTF